MGDKNSTRSRNDNQNRASRRKDRPQIILFTENVRGLKRDEDLEAALASVGQRGGLAACWQETWRSGNERLECPGIGAVLLAGRDQQICNRRGCATVEGLALVDRGGGCVLLLRCAALCLVLVRSGVSVVSLGVSCRVVLRGLSGLARARKMRRKVGSGIKPGLFCCSFLDLPRHSRGPLLDGDPGLSSYASLAAARGTGLVPGLQGVCRAVRNGPASAWWWRRPEPCVASSSSGHPARWYPWCSSALV